MSPEQTSPPDPDRPLFDVALRLEPGVYAIEMTGDFSAAQMNQIMEKLEEFGNPRGISFIVLARGLKISRAGV